VEDRRKALNVYNRCLQPAAKKLPREAVSGCLAVVIEIEKTTGRRKGKSWSDWQYDFRL
jgi:hypothetical protein